MRLSEDKIKQAILHPENEVRLTALRYFNESYSADPTVMPVVIRAVEQYDKKYANRLLNNASDLVQTDVTMQWIIAELNRRSKLKNHDPTRHSYYLLRLLDHAPAELLLRHESDIVQCRGLEVSFLENIKEKWRLLSWDSEACWKELEKLCENGKDTQDFDSINLRYAGHLIEAIVREKEKFADRVVAILVEEIEEFDGNPMLWMELLAVQLAGEMRLETAIPFLIKKLYIDADFLNDQTIYALAKIGTNVVIDAVSAPFAQSEWHYRLYATHPLEHIHTDFAVQKCLTLLPQEKNPVIKTSLALALLAHFAYEGMDAVRELILSDNWDPQMADLREKLVTTCTIMEERFPENDEWKAETDKEIARQERFFDDENWEIGDGDALSQTSIDLNTKAERRAMPTVGNAQNFKTIPAESVKIGRNDSCPCGSGKKYKKCCMERNLR